MLKKSMLTLDTLNRFEDEFDISILTDDEKRKIEHDAYCANMGTVTRSKGASAVWDWFIHLIIDVDHIAIKPRDPKARI